MSRVFVIQKPVFFDRAMNKWVDKYDLSTAGVYGELIFLIPPGNLLIGQLPSVLTTLRRRFAEYGLQDTDYILASGDPVAIAAAALIAGDIIRNVTILKYDKKRQSYAPYRIER